MVNGDNHHHMVQHHPPKWYIYPIICHTVYLNKFAYSMFSLAEEMRADFTALVILHAEHVLLVPVRHPLEVLHPLRPHIDVLVHGLLT